MTSRDHAAHGVTPEEAERLLAAIFPTCSERALAAFVTWAYRHPEGGLIDWLGDRADDLKVWKQRRRARRRAQQSAHRPRPAP